MRPEAGVKGHELAVHVAAACRVPLPRGSRSVVGRSITSSASARARLASRHHVAAIGDRAAPLGDERWLMLKCEARSAESRSGARTGANRASTPAVTRPGWTRSQRSCRERGHAVDRGGEDPSRSRLRSSSLARTVSSRRSRLLAGAARRRVYCASKSNPARLNSKYDAGSSPRRSP